VDLLPPAILGWTILITSLDYTDCVSYSPLRAIGPSDQELLERGLRVSNEFMGMYQQPRHFSRRSERGHGNGAARRLIDWLGFKDPGFPGAMDQESRRDFTILEAAEPHWSILSANNILLGYYHRDCGPDRGMQRQRNSP